LHALCSQAEGSGIFGAQALRNFALGLPTTRREREQIEAIETAEVTCAFKSSH
jgi:hypothetical protein